MGLWDQLLNAQQQQPPPGLWGQMDTAQSTSLLPPDFAMPQQQPPPKPPQVVTDQAPLLKGQGQQRTMPIDQGGANTQELINQLGSAQGQASQNQGNMIAQLQDQLSGLKNKKLPVNLQPLAQLVDSWTGSKLAPAAAPEETAQSRQEQIQALQNAIAKGQQSMSQDDLNFLKDKLTAQYHADDIKQRGIDNGLKRDALNAEKATVAGARADKLDATQLQHYQDQLTKDKAFADATSHLAEVDKTKELLDQALVNPAAANALKLSMARLYVPSRLNETEINAFGGSKQIGDKLSQIEQEMEKGTLTQSNHDYLAKLVTAQELNAKKTQQKQLEFHASQYAHNSPHTLEEAKQLIGGSTYEAPQDDEDAAALSWARSNPKDPRAVKILALHGGK